jgi:myosin heavy subunit
MAKVNSINQVDLLNNILNRFKSNQIFTNVGKTLIVVNPYRQITNAFTQDTMNIFIEESKAKSLKGYNKNIKLEPHIYQISIDTINNLLSHRKPQAIVISGESGAGKTETAKQAMKFITYYFSRGYQTSEESLEEKILSCNPILESFGNSKTVRNDNSSRFGKYIKILIDYEKNMIIGGNMVIYLLEKTRVCKVAKGERNFHIFYQIIKAFRYILIHDFDFDKIFSDFDYIERVNKNLRFRRLVMEGFNKDFIINKSGLFNSYFKSENLNDCSNFSYLLNDIYDIEKVDDVKCFFETLESFLLTGFQDQEILKIIEITCGILLLGNIEIQSNPIENEECVITERGYYFIEKAANLLDIEPKILKQALLYKIVEINKKFEYVSLELKDCITSRDTLAKELYYRLFSFMVRKMNLILDGRKTSVSGRSSITSMSICHIGLLDIFGFECFETNSLEQLCINYANEKLQQMYINDIFKETRRLFETEGLFEHFQAINYEDNQKIIDLIDGSPNGIFICLESKCKMKQVDDKGFARNVMFQNKNSTCLLKSRLGEENFIIKHTAKDVDYNSKGYCEKNLDEFKLIMENSLSTIKDKFKIDVFASESNLSEQKPGMFNKEKFLCGKFMKDMSKLKLELEKCVCHYIRCLKPNEAKKANLFVSSFVMQQIRYLGILDTIRIRREGFPIRLTHLQFFMRYEDVCSWDGKPDPKQLSWDDPNLGLFNEKLVSQLCPTFSTDLDILFGKTMMLIKQESYDKLDKIRGKLIAVIEKSVTLIAMKFRSRKCRINFLKLRKYAELFKEKYFMKKCYVNIRKIKKFAKMVTQRIKIIKIRENIFTYGKKLLKIKKLVRSYTIKFRLKKVSMKLLRLKRAFAKFRCKLKYILYKRMKFLVRQILEKSLNIYYTIKSNKSAINIQKHFRTFMFKKKKALVWEESKRKIQDLRYTMASTKIQKNYRGYKLRKFKKLSELLARKIPAYIRSRKMVNYIKNLRIKIVIIQRAFRKYFIFQKILRIRTAEFNELENTLESENKIYNDVTLFPNNNLRAKSQKYSSIQKIEKDFLNKHYYERKLLSHQPELYLNTTHLKVSHFNDPKLLFFAHILDLDVMVNTDEVYQTPWSETVCEIQNFCIEKSHPVMGIELGGTHTSLINSNGKIFTWGYNSNGQCGYEMKKDLQFKYDFFKLNKKKDKKCAELQNNENSLNKKTEIFNKYLEKFETIMTEENEKKDNKITYVDDNFSITKDKNYYNNDENNIKEVFSHKSFNDFYYLKDPIIIDNYECKEIKSGEDYSILLNTDGNVIVCGKNSKWSLGIKNKKNVFTPQVINEIFSNEKMNVKIISLACNNKIKVFLNEVGEVYVLDINKLGLPKKIKINIKFSNVECGHDFTVLLASSGLIYTFGNNSQGQLGHGDFIVRSHPTEISYFKFGGIKAVQMSCGYKHVVIKNSLNKVYTWGWVNIY